MTTNKNETCETMTTENNEYKKICRNFSFAYKEGYEALDWLHEKRNDLKGGKSAYLVKLLLEDKARNEK